MSEGRGQEQHEVEEIDDIISNLPDCILHHVLSFMPTKEVVKTSILSRRWKNLWAFVPNIDLDDTSFCGRDDDRCQLDATSFINFVERFLRLRGAMSVEKFRLSCDTFLDAFQIHSWISDAIIHNVQELDLTLFAIDPSAIPRSMFDRSSLVSLKISMRCEIGLPSRVSFPCLKTLQLSFVWFGNDDFTEKLLPGCPVLEKLYLSHNRLKNLKNIVISSSTLKSLTFCYIPCIWEFNDPTCKIKIDAKNLTYFEYQGYQVNDFFFSNTPSLHESFIHISNPCERRNEVASRAIDLFKQLQGVVSLTLSHKTMRSLLVADDNRFPTFDKDRFPVFRNLTHLILTMEVGMDHTFSVLMGLLYFYPVLQSIHICFSKGFSPNIHLREYKLIWSRVPMCMKNRLKTLTFKNFHGYNSEMCFLKCVLKHAFVLERVDIFWCLDQSYQRDLKWKTKVRKEFEKLKRSSCVINFY